MNNLTNNSTARNMEKVSFSLSILLILVAWLAWVGWQYDIGFFKSINPGGVTLKFNSAICFFCCGLTLALYPLQKESFILKLLVTLLPFFVLLVATLTLGQDVFGFNAGIDDLFYKEDATALQPYPGRMSPYTATSFILCGSSLILFSNKKISPFLFQWLSLAYGFMAIFVLIVYLLTSYQTHNLFGFINMPFHAAVLFVVMALSVLFTRPNDGLLQLVSGNHSGGKFFRNTFPLLIGIVISISWLRYHGELEGFYDTHTGIAFYAIIFIIIFAFLIYFNAKHLVRAEEKLQRSEMHLRSIFESAPIGFLLVNRDFKIIEYNNLLFEFGSKAGYNLAKYINLLDLFTPEKKKIFKERLQNVSGGKTINYQVSSPNGELVMDVTITPAIDATGQFAGACFTVADITRAKAIEMEIQKKVDELEEFNLLVVDRELRMIELKQTINHLSAQLDLSEPYDLDFNEPGDKKYKLKAAKN